MAAKFEIFEDPAGRFRFHFRASSGEIIAASDGYGTVARVEEAIQAIRTHAPNAVVETLHQSPTHSVDDSVGLIDRDPPA